MIEPVFQNLLSNAFKYSPHGRVVVSASEHDSAVTCVVHDGGAGIPPHVLAEVFDKGTPNPNKDGTGFGLAIVEQIFEAHGGTVKTESIDGPGAGGSAGTTSSRLPPKESLIYLVMSRLCRKGRSRLKHLALGTL